ncbi:hypothetical protein D3C73_724860 [compost metagenome]
MHQWAGTEGDTPRFKKPYGRSWISTSALAVYPPLSPGVKALTFLRSTSQGVEARLAYIQGPALKLKIPPGLSVLRLSKRSLLISDTNSEGPILYFLKLLLAIAPPGEDRAPCLRRNSCTWSRAQTTHESICGKWQSSIAFSSEGSLAAS